MRIRPGRNLIRSLAIGLCASLPVFAIPQIIWIWPPLLLGMLLAAVRDLAVIRRQLPGFRLLRQLPAIVGRDHEFTVSWTLSRDAGPGTAQGELRDCLPGTACPAFYLQPFSLPESEQSQQWSNRIRIPVRGMHVFGPAWLRLRGPLDFLEGQQPLDTTQAIRVYPETYHAAERLQQDPAAEIALLDRSAHVRQHGIGTEFESLNEFRDGDDPRRIDWRTTARVGHLVVRRYEIERHRDVMLVVDCGRLMGADADRGSKLDCAIDASLMLSRVALREGDRCGIALFDDQVLGYLPPQTGMASMQAITNCVFSAQTRWRESDFSRIFATLQQRQQKRAMIILLSDMIDAETTHRFRAALATLARRHVILFAALQTPLLEQMIASPWENVAESTRHAVGYRLLRDRERALHAIRRSGIEVLDVVPEQLTVPLINQFLELRRRSLL